MANEFIARKGLIVLDVPEEITLTGSTISVLDSDGKIKKISVSNFYNETGIEDSKIAAENAAITATTKANEASTSASNALTSEQNAATSATEADNAATLSTQQATLSSAARDEAEAAKLAAQNSEDNAATSEANALLSAQAAAASELDAETAASQAIAAKNAVEGITDFTDGNIYRGNGTGIEAIQEREFGGRKGLYQKTPLIFNKPSILELYDNCEREGSTNNEPMGNADSGQPYVNLVGTSGKYDGRAGVRGLWCQTGDIYGIENINVLPNIFLARSGIFRVAGWSGQLAGIYFFSDQNNWVFIGAAGINEGAVIMKDAGVQTVVSTVSNGNVFTRNQVEFHFILSPNTVSISLFCPAANLTIYSTSNIAVMDKILQATSIGFSGLVLNYSITIAKTFGF